MWWTVLFFLIGSVLGCLLRFLFITFWNPVFPLISLGTLSANLLGCFFMGIFMGIENSSLAMPIELKVAITTGFLGGLTTFSGFSAEALSLFIQKELVLASIVIGAHVIGSLLSTICGFYAVKIFIKMFI